MQDILISTQNSPLGEIIGWLTIVTLDLEYESIADPKSHQIQDLKLWMIRKIFEIRSRIARESYLDTQIQKVLKMLMVDADIIFDNVSLTEISHYLDQLQEIADAA
jgi:hypothetical protein